MNLYLTFLPSFGMAPFIFHRAQLISVLYNELPSDAKAHYHLNKKIMSMDVSKEKDSVEVTCTDGSTFQGSIVLGADGVHSKTRTLMRDLALSQDTQPDWKEAVEPFSTEYRCLWSSFPLPAEVEQGYVTDAQSKDMSLMFLAGKERGWILLFKRIVPSEASTATTKPEKATRARWTESDMRTFAMQFAEFPVTETLKVKDVYEARLNEGMADLEEGILKRWSWGRVVLAGDACHKFTPNAGRGLNNGIQDVVALCNGLHEMLNSKQGISPDEAALNKVFSEYQAIRSEPLKSDYKQSRFLSRMHAWRNMQYYIVARYIISCEWLVMLMLKFSASGLIKEALVLNYILADEPFSALIKWKHPLVAKEDSHK